MSLFMNTIEFCSIFLLLTKSSLCCFLNLYVLFSSQNHVSIYEAAGSNVSWALLSQSICSTFTIDSHVCGQFLLTRKVCRFSNISLNSFGSLNFCLTRQLCWTCDYAVCDWSSSMSKGVFKCSRKTPELWYCSVRTESDVKNYSLMETKVYDWSINFNCKCPTKRYRQKQQTMRLERSPGLQKLSLGVARSIILAI